MKIAMAFLLMFCGMQAGYWFGHNQFQPAMVLSLVGGTMSLFALMVEIFS